jgi:hypothetical protein
MHSAIIPVVPIIPVTGGNNMQPKGTKRGTYPNKPRKGIRYKQSRFAYFLGKLICFAYEQGFEITLGESTVDVMRCDKCGNKVSKHSKHSYHYRRLAQDINLFKFGSGGWRYQTTAESHRALGEYWMGLDPGCVWGGSWKSRDANHYSYMEGKRFA